MYWSLTGNPLDLVALTAFLAACMVGGWGLVHAGFRLPARDRTLAGAALGLVIAIWVANLLGRWIPSPLSSWISGTIVFAGGLAAWWTADNRKLRLHMDWRAWAMWAAVAVMTFAFFRIGRGVAIFDDRKNLSMISLLAAGGPIPPPFYMNPDFLFPYHYGFQLFGAMLMRIGGLFPWSAFDLAKGILGALTVGLSVIWGRRATRSWVGAVVVGMVLLLASGSRWLLLLVPSPIVSGASRDLVMWGSAAQTAADLPHALGSAWGIEGGPPFPLPFAFVNGIFQPLVLYLQSGPVSLGLMALFLLLVLYPARSARWAWGVLAVLLALWGLAAESSFVLFGLGLVGASVLIVSRRGRRQARSQALAFLAIAAVAAIVAMLQGGTRTEAARRVLESGSAGGSGSSFAGFSFRAIPSIVSSHLGEMRLSRPGEILLAVFELGPALLLAPVAGWAALRALRRGQVLPLAFGLSTFFGFIVPIFVRYEVDRDITRLTYYALIGWLLLAAAPMAAAWRSGRLLARAAILVGGAVLVFGGIIVSGSLLTAFPRAVFSDGILPVDAAMAKAVWNRLEPGALVLDSDSWRAVALTGRLTRSAEDSSTLLESWQTLIDQPEVGRVVQSGFGYMYVDQYWWEGMPETARLSLLDECVVEVAAADDDGANGDRWLFDLRACPPG
ncbi:MAG TPA: hypothetical protein VFI11_03445 [Anaerolineales bacterium]|nr:hypothetical protein [Anaerolineales bacterium]